MITLEELIVIIVRLVGALPVLKWAFAGAIIAILVDLSAVSYTHLTLPTKA